MGTSSFKINLSLCDANRPIAVKFEKQERNKERKRKKEMRYYFRLKIISTNTSDGLSIILINQGLVMSVTEKRFA